MPRLGKPVRMAVPVTCRVRLRVARVFLSHLARRIDSPRIG